MTTGPALTGTPTSPPDLLLRDVSLDGGRRDVLLTAGRVAAVGTGLSTATTRG